MNSLNRWIVLIGVAAALAAGACYGAECVSPGQGVMEVDISDDADGKVTRKLPVVEVAGLVGEWKAAMAELPGDEGRALVRLRKKYGNGDNIYQVVLHGIVVNRRFDKGTWLVADFVDAKIARRPAVAILVWVDSVEQAGRSCEIRMPDVAVGSEVWLVGEIWVSDSALSARAHRLARTVPPKRRTTPAAQCEPIATPKPEPIVAPKPEAVVKRLPEVVSTSFRRSNAPRDERACRARQCPRPAAAAKPCGPRPARHALRLRRTLRRAWRHR